MCMCTCTHMNTSMHTHTHKLQKLQKIPFLKTLCQVFYTTIVNTSPLLNRTSHTHSIGERQPTLCRLFPVMLADAEPGCRPCREKSLILCETDQPLKRRERAFCLRPTLPILIWGQKFESSWVSMTRECPFLRPVGLSSLSSDRESCF